MNHLRLLIIASFLFLSACGGGGGGSSTVNETSPPEPSDTIAPTLELQFPPPGRFFLAPGNPLGYPNTMSMQGLADDNVAVQSILVDGISHPRSGLNPSIWEIYAELSYGLNQFNIQASDAAGNLSVTTSASIIYDGPFLYLPYSLMFDASRNRLLTIDTFYEHIIELDLSNNHRNILQIPIDGFESNIYFDSPIGIYDSSSNKIYFVEDPNLKSFDLETGETVIISTFNSTAVGDGPLLSTVDDGTGAAMAYDPASKIIYVIAADPGEPLGKIIAAIDISTGDRSIISTSIQGSGTHLTFLDAICWDSTADRLLVVAGFGRLFAVDVGNGNRTMISEALSMTGSGPDFTGANQWSLAHDPVKNRALFVAWGDAYPDLSYSLFSVDLDNGARTIVSNNLHVGTGTALSSGGVAALTVDPINQKAYAVMRNTYAGLEIDLTNGNRRLMSSGIGTGIKLMMPARSRFDAGNRRLIISDSWLQAIVSVDVDTGDRTILSGGGTGTGTSFAFPTAVDLNAESTKALVLDRTLKSVFEVDLSTGDRFVISGGGAGSGSDLDEPEDLVFDEDNQRVLVVDRALNAVVAIDIITGARNIVLSNLAPSSAGDSGPVAIEIDRSTRRAFVAIKDWIDQGISFNEIGKIVEMDLATDTAKDLTTFLDAETYDLRFSDITMAPDGNSLYAFHGMTTYSIVLANASISRLGDFEGHAFSNAEISSIETGPFGETVFMFDQGAGAVMLLPNIFSRSSGLIVSQ